MLRLVPITLFALGCAASPPEVLAEVSTALTSSNGRSVNGTSLNGRSVNGRSVNGRSVNGVALMALTLAGATMADTHIEGTVLVGRTDGGAVLRGADFIGARLDATATDGSPIPLRLDDIRVSADPEVYYHMVSYLTDSSWKPLCGLDGAGRPVPAIPLAGQWSETTGNKVSSSAAMVTFGCKGIGAIAKCVELGYKPWKTWSGVRLERHHQACTRMIRADYCGNGTSWTEDGRVINVFDGLGIQRNDTLSSPLTVWLFDAEWDETGARCMLKNRQAELLGLLPPCYSLLNSLTCGTFQKAHFTSGTLLMNYVSVPSALTSLLD